jgi:hypothetical protein
MAGSVLPHPRPLSVVAAADSHYSGGEAAAAAAAGVCTRTQTPWWCLWCCTTPHSHDADGNDVATDEPRLVLRRPAGRADAERWAVLLAASESVSEWAEVGLLQRATARRLPPSAPGGDQPSRGPYRGTSLPPPARSQSVEMWTSAVEAHTPNIRADQQGRWSSNLSSSSRVKA